MMILNEASLRSSQKVIYEKYVKYQINEEMVFFEILEHRKF